MDKETAERLTRLESDVDVIQKEREAWSKLIKEAVVKTVTWLFGVGMAGILFGWHLPTEVRKWLTEWISK